MKSSDLVSIGDLYGNMLNSVKKEIIKEGKKQPPNAFNSKLPIEKSKPIDGYNQPLNDPNSKPCEDEDNETPVKPPVTKRSKAAETLHQKSKDPKFSDEQRKKFKKESSKTGFYAEDGEDEDKETPETKKNITERINRIMSVSHFDKLFKKVLKENFGQSDDSEMDALGLDDATPDTEMEDDFGDDELGDEGEGEDTVTFTLDRTTAQTLIDVLQGALGGEEGEGEDTDLDFGDEGDDLGMDEGGDEGGDFNFDEDEEGFENKVAPDKKAAFQQKNNKVGGKANPKGSGKASTDVTDDQGTKDGAPSYTHLQGKDNKVKSVVQVGDFFK